MSTVTIPAVHLHIGGEQRAAGSGGVHTHINPATGLPDAEIPMAGPDEVDDAVRIAHEAFATWRETRPAKRRALLQKLADLIEQNAAEFIRRGVIDNGTPTSVASHFPAKAAEWVHYYAGWADKIMGDTLAYPTSEGELAYTLAQPYGVIGAIITWNAPLISLVMKIPAALAAGNTVVVKPSELTPFTPELFADLVKQAGFPEGVVNILPGTGEAGARLVAHPLVKKITFTGGPETGRKILHGCAESMKPSVMELGGKSANVIFEDADVTLACKRGTFMPVGPISGQGCALPTRMLVQDTIYDQVIAQVTQIVKSIRVGDPFDPKTVSGPVINKAAVDRILGMIERAKKDGARLITGGMPLKLDGDLAGGYFIEPTVFADVDPRSELAQREVFGPVLAITRFSTDDEAIAIANSTEYGLSAYVETGSLTRARRFADELVAGEVLINGPVPTAAHRPFGGIGLSGLGKEGGRAGIEEFLQFKVVVIAGDSTPAHKS